MKECINCQKKFKDQYNQKYCSIKCREHKRWLLRKNNPDYIIKQRIRSRRYDAIHRVENRLKRNERQKSKPYRDKQNKWRRDNKYWLIQYRLHPEANKAKIKRYRLTPNGQAHRLIESERRRKKFPISFLTKNDLEYLKKRDITCIYCDDDFILDYNDLKYSLKRPTVDHLDCNKPLSKYNAVRCCQSCNSSKKDLPLKRIIPWMKRKGYTIKPILTHLIKKATLSNP